MTIYISGTRINPNAHPSWWAQNGAKRMRLELYINTEVHQMDNQSDTYVCHGVVSHVQSYGEATVVVRPGEAGEGQGVIHIWTNKHCGFEVHPREQEVAHYRSYGGPKNSQSSIAIVCPPAFIAEHTYKHATPKTWYYLHNDGVIRLGTAAQVMAIALTSADDLRTTACKQLVQMMGWEASSV